MDRYPLGRDIHVSWSLDLDGQDINLSECTFFFAYKAAGGSRFVPANQYTVSNDTLQWTFAGEDQFAYGVYSLHLVVFSDGEPVAEFKNDYAFEIIHGAVSDQPQSVALESSVETTQDDFPEPDDEPSDEPAEYHSSSPLYMEKIPLGSNIVLNWNLLTPETFDFDLTECELRLYYTASGSGFKRAHDYELKTESGYTIQWNFAGSEQTRYGIYSLFLEVYNDGLIAVLEREYAFELVHRNGSDLADRIISFDSIVTSFGGGALFSLIDVLNDGHSTVYRGDGETPAVAGDVLQFDGEKWHATQAGNLDAIQSLNSDVAALWVDSRGIHTRVEDAEGNISSLEQTAEGFDLRVASVEGNVGELTLTAEEFETRISDAEGNISTLEQTAESLTSSIEDAEGNISVLQQTATSLSSAISDAEGNISTLQQTASGLESRVEDAEDNISTISQTAVSIQLQVDSQQGDIATLEVSARGLTSRVSNAEGNISLIDQKADRIGLEVQGLDRELTRYEGYVDGVIEGIQEQIDGAIDTWFYDYAPVHTDSHGVPDSQVPLTNVSPYADWLAEETRLEKPEEIRNEHVSDIFYDTKSGYAYRFIGTGEEGSRVYTWVPIEDSAVVKALEDAAKAQDTADSKRRVFLVQPTTPYDAGDLWVKEVTVGGNTTREIYRCSVSRASGSFISSDWAPADDYGYKVNKSNLEVLSNAIAGTSTQITYNTDGTISDQSTGAMVTAAGQVRLQVANGAIDTAVGPNGKITTPLLGTGIDIINGDITLIANHISLKNQSNITGLELVTVGEAPNQRVVINTGSLNVNGIFTTSAWTSEESALQGYADTAAGNAQTAAEGYADTKAGEAETNAKNYANSSAYLNEHVLPMIQQETSGLAVDSDYSYLKTALENQTTALGGLMLTSLIQLGATQSGSSWTVNSGISGIYDSTKRGNGIAAWFGGPMVDHLASPATTPYAATLFRMDGSGYLAGGEIQWGASGELIIHGTSAATPITIENAELKDGNKTLSVGDLILNIEDLLELKSWFVKETYDLGDGQTHYRLKLVGSSTGIEGLHVEGHILSDDDQIVGSGTPGGGGGGGAGYLYELKDFQSGQSKATTTGTMLMYQATGITDVNGNTGAWKYASPSDVASAIGLGDYVAKSGSTMTGDLQLKNSSLRFLDDNGNIAGWLTWGGSDKQPKWYDTSGSTAAWETIYHSGNLSLATLAGSTGVGSIAQPVYYTGSSFALVQATFGNASYGEHDADNIASNGLWYYNSNGPATSLGASTTDGALYSQAYSASWVGQIAQDYRNGHLYVRGKNNGTWQSWLKVWDSGNSNSTSVNWSASTLTANYAHLGNGNSITNLELFGSATGSAIGFYKSGTRVALLYSNGDAPFQRYSGDWTIGYTIYDSGNSNKSDVPWTCSTLTSSVATGTAPLTVASTTMVDNLNANYLGGYALDDVVPHSAYSYGNGYLVKTGFSADATRHYLITIEGSAYNYSPIFSQAEVYTNQTTSTNTAFAYAYVVHYGRMKINNLQAFFYGGLLYIWFQQPRTYCAIKVKVQYHNASANYVTAISNEAIPSSGVTCLTSFTEYQGAFTDSNVASATKLQTERTIWGQSFDGTGNVNGLITVSGIGGAAITQEKGANTVFRLGSGSSATTAGTEYGILSLFQNGTEMVRLYANSSNPSWINAGSFGVGTASPGAKFHVYGTSGASITPMSVFEHTGDYEWNCPSSFLAPNVTAGHNVSFGIGKAASTKNQGSLQFYYAGSSSNSNLFGLGLYGVDYALTVSGGGNVGIGLGATAAIYTLHVAGASAALINSSGPVYQLISAGTNGWSYIRLSSGASSDTVWDLATTNSTSSAIAQVGAFEIRDGKDSAAGISIRHASSDYGKLVVRVNSGQSSIGYWSTSNNLVSGYPIWTVGYTADTGDTFGWYCKSSTPGWKMNLSPNGDLTNTGSIYTNRIFLSRSSNNAYGRIGFYSSSYYTWYFYMGPTGSGYPCPTGAATPSGSVVTSWALRSLIENASGYGWTWESCSNGHNQTPVIQMELSSNSGILRTRGDQVISSDINLKTHLEPVKYTIEDIAKTRAVTFDWKDGRGKSAGSIAQDWKPLIPELVHGDEGNMTLAYGQIALVNSILLAKHETEQDKEIRKLKARVRDLEKQLKMRS